MIEKKNIQKNNVDRRYSKKDCINLVQYFITPYNKRIILTTKHTSCSRAYALDGLQITTTQYDVRSNIFKTTTLAINYLHVSSLEDYYYYLCTMHKAKTTTNTATHGNYLTTTQHYSYKSAPSWV